MTQREEIIEYVKKKYDTVPEYLWKKYPNDAVFRHRENGKWYGLLMTVTKEKLGIGEKGQVDIIDLKCYPEMIGMLRQEKGVFPGYHMNKEYWITILLDGTVLKEKILELLDLSYEITA